MWVVLPLQIPENLAMMTNMAFTPVLQAPNLTRLSWLVHGFSTRHGGYSKCYGGRNLNLGYTPEDSREAVERNRRKFLLLLGAGNKRDPWPLVTLKQVHSDVIHVVKSGTPEQLIGDGLVTNVPHIALAVQSADCFPVLLVDRKNRAVGAFHAGWRGTLKRIVEKGLGIMRREYGTEPQDVSPAIGPGIQKCCYEIGEEVRNQFESQFDYAAEVFHELYSPDPIRQKYPLLFLNVRPPGHSEPATKLHLDLVEANRRQLLQAGVPKTRISSLQECTSCTPGKFFSHRAEKGTTGRMMGAVGIVHG
jgi:YfiH family protein